MLDHKINIIPLYKNPKYPNAIGDAVPIEEGSYVTFSYRVFKCGIGNDFIGCGYIKWLDSLLTHAIFFDDGHSLVLTDSNYILLSGASKILHYGKLSKEEEEYNNKSVS